jgi:uncharacterized surface protein with fasciclin (FAS1) repeats
MKTYISSLIAIFLFICTSVHSQNTYADDSDRVVTKILGTDTIYSNISLVDNLSKISDFSKQVQMFQLTGFETFTENMQMVTVFVVRNNAFDVMNEKELEQFLSTPNAKNLSALLSSYMIPGRVDEHAIRRAVTDGGGAASFRTISGKTIRFHNEGDLIYLITDNGSKSKLLETNFYHNKGFFHITDKLPVKKK